MIIFLYGPDTYRSKEALEKLKEKYLKRYGSNLDVIKLNGKEISENDLKAIWQTRGFFTKNRLIVIEKLLENKNKELLEKILVFLKKERLGNILVFWEEEPPKSNLLNFLLKQKYVQKFNPLKGKKLNWWVKNEVEKRGGKILPEAIEFLISYIGENLWRISNELEKLIAYSENSFISREMINTLTWPKIDENIWHLIDAVGEKNKIKALKMLNSFLENKFPPELILIMLTRHYRILLKMKDLIEKKKSLSEIYRKINLPTFIFEKFLRETKVYSWEELKKIYRCLLWIDIKMKTSQITPRVLFTLLIMN